MMDLSNFQLNCRFKKSYERKILTGVDRMLRKNWKNLCLIITIICGVLNSPIIALQGTSNDDYLVSTQIPEIAPSQYTLGVTLGEEQKYMVVNAFSLYSNGTTSSKCYVMIANSHLWKDQELLITISKIDQNLISYDIELKQLNNTYKYLQPSSVSRRFYEIPRAFITTTNHTVLEHSLQKYSNIEYEITQTKFNFTSTGWDVGRKADTQGTWIYDLDTGWLLSLHYQAYNNTHLLREYEIRIDNWTSFWTTPTSTNLHFPPIWVFLIVSIILYHQRRRK